MKEPNFESEKVIDSFLWWEELSVNQISEKTLPSKYFLNFVWKMKAPNFESEKVIDSFWWWEVLSVNQISEATVFQTFGNEGARKGQ